MSIDVNFVFAIYLFKTLCHKYSDRNVLYLFFVCYFFKSTLNFVRLLRSLLNLFKIYAISAFYFSARSVTVFSFFSLLYKTNAINKPMDTLAKITILLPLLLFVTLQSNSQSETVITKTIKTQPYGSIEVSGPMEVYLVKGTEGNIGITTQEKIQSKIVVESDGETLRISLKKDVFLRNSVNIKIQVPFEEISKISLNGSGKIEGKNKVSGNALDLAVNGSGDIELSIDVKSIRAAVDGSGEIELEGNATDAEVNITGSGEFNGEELVSDHARIHIMGSGEVSIYAKKKLQGAVEGSGTVKYGGNPSSNNVRVIGSGKVRSM